MHQPYAMSRITLQNASFSSNHVLDQPLIALHGILEVFDGQALVISMRHQDTTRSIQIPRMISLKFGHVCSVINNHGFKTYSSLAFGFSRSWGDDNKERMMEE